MKRLLLAAATAAGITTALPAAAQFAKPEDAVKYRKAAMTVMANHFGRVNAMAQGRVPFDGGAAAANAELVATLSTLPFAGFIDGTASTEKNGASASIWSERSKFDAAAKKMQDEVVKLVSAAKGGSQDQLKSAAGGVGQACKACHDDFRNP